jgi:hypothetical protein
MEPKVDPAGMLLPHLLATKPGHERPAGMAPDAPWNTGAELQHLEKYQPFPYGTSTFALAYNYAKRSQILLSVGKQSPLQVSDSVIDSRPAVELKGWGEDEFERGRVFEIQAFGVRAPTERLDMEAPTAAIPPDPQRIADRAAVAMALYSYEMATRVSDDACREYERHMADPQFFDRGALYHSHIDAASAVSVMASADHDYLKAASLPAADPQRERLLTEAARKYQDAIGHYQLTILKYYVTDAMAASTFGDNVNRENVAKQPRAAQDQIMQRVRQALTTSGITGHEEDVAEYETYIARANTRLGQLLRR